MSTRCQVHTPHDSRSVPLHWFPRSIDFLTQPAGPRSCCLREATAFCNVDIEPRSAVTHDHSCTLNKMSTAGNPEPKIHNPLFRLPRELRDIIYEQVFADLFSHPLYIRKFVADPQWKVCYNPHARVPGLLLTSKAIYSEAKSCLYSACNPPRIIVDDQEITLHAIVKQPEELGERWGFAVRDLETILPLLTTVEELNLEIKAFHESAVCLLLIRWIRAVLRARGTPLRKLWIGVHVGRSGRDAFYDGANSARDEIIMEASRIKSRNRPWGETWILRRERWECAQGPPNGSVWREEQAVQEEVMPGPLACSMAWRNLIHGRSHYWVDTFIDENERVVQPRSYIWARLCDIWMSWRGLDTS